MSANGIYGLSGSGLDIESMVKVGMMSRQNRLDKMQQTYTKNEWKKDDLLEVYNKLQDYNISTLSTYTKSYTTNARTATSSNELIKATANSSAPAMNHTITVNQTATNAYLVGTANLKRNENTSAEDFTKFSSLKDINFSTNGISFTIDDGLTDTGYVPATYSTANFSSTSDFFSTNTSTFKSFLQTAVNAESNLNDEDKSNLTALSFEVTDGSVNEEGLANSGAATITYEDLYTLLYKDGATVQDFANLLNDKIQAEGVGVTVDYDETNGLTFTNKTASSSANVTVSVTEGVYGDTGAGHKILESLYNAASATDKSDKFEIDDEGLYNLNLTGTTGSAATLGSGSETIIISATDISKGATFYDLMSKINNAGTNIRLNYDSNQDKFSIYNMKTGTANSINIVANNAETAALFDAMGLKDAKSATDLSTVKAVDFKNGEVATVQGTNAEVFVDGDKYTNIESNSLLVNGVTYNFGNVTQAGTTAVVTVEQDKDKIVENVKSFVESYNKLLGELTAMYDEAPNSSYAPLTDAQKAEMTEDQVKKWEEKAKAGMLYHDRTLGKIINDMKNTLMTQIDGSNKYNSVYTIGISTKGYKGQIQLDEDKLRAALTDDPDAVYRVLSAIDTNEDDDLFNNTNGIAQRLTDVMSQSIKTVQGVAGTSKDNSDDSTLSTLLRNLQTKMSSFQSMMNAFEESLYKKYDAMESTLAMLGSQLNYVTGMFS